MWAHCVLAKRKRQEILMCLLLNAKETTGMTYYTHIVAHSPQTLPNPSESTKRDIV